MFTGIIEALGTVSALQRKDQDLRLTIRSDTLGCGDIRLGDSIAVNGICLTAVEQGKDYFVADVSAETLSRTTFVNLQQGSAVNLEPALALSSRFGGHLVSGHVDGIGKVTQKAAVGESTRFQITVAKDLKKYIAEKGSICVDGISLTVNAVEGNEFSVNIVPHTILHTTLKHGDVGTEVNIEVDVIARYLERLLLSDDKDLLKRSNITIDRLKQAGYLD